MSDLRFLIVNNHLPHSVAEKGKLDSRVTFPVYQDTEDRGIWARMRGGKDDVFIYDRCGRLAYFIPFPLSIMNTEDALVPTAILATYFQSPCGATCDYTPSSTPLLLFNDTTTPDFTTPLYPEYPSKNSSSSEEERQLSSNSTDNSTLLEINPDMDYLSSFDDDSMEDVFNDTLDVYVEPQHHQHNDLSFVLERNETAAVDQRLNFTSNGTTVDDPVVAFNYSRSNDIPSFVVESFSNETDGENVTVTTTTTMQVPRKKSDRCAEADMSVCRTWSKRKLLRAQTCCNNGVHSAALSESCRNYGKKRCKKIRTVLKCCLKTSYIEGKPDDVKAGDHASLDDVKAKVNTTHDDVKEEGHASPDDVKTKVSITPDDVKTKVNAPVDDVKAGSHASPDDVKTSADDITIEVTTRVSYVVCCKEEGGQRTCRVSLDGACEADETVGQDRLQTN